MVSVDIIKIRIAAEKAKLRKLRCKIYDKKYRATPKGKEKDRRNYLKRRADPEQVKKLNATNKRWWTRKNSFRLFWQMIHKEYNLN